MLPPGRARQARLIARGLRRPARHWPRATRGAGGHASAQRRNRRIFTCGMPKLVWRPPGRARKAADNLLSAELGSVDSHVELRRGAPLIGLRPACSSLGIVPAVRPLVDAGPRGQGRHQRRARPGRGASLHGCRVVPPGQAPNSNRDHAGKLLWARAAAGRSSGGAPSSAGYVVIDARHCEWCGWPWPRAARKRPPDATIPRPGLPATGPTSDWAARRLEGQLGEPIDRLLPRRADLGSH